MDAPIGLRRARNAPARGDDRSARPPRQASDLRLPKFDPGRPCDAGREVLLHPAGGEAAVRDGHRADPLHREGVPLCRRKADGAALPGAGERLFDHPRIQRAGARPDGRRLHLRAVHGAVKGPVRRDEGAADERQSHLGDRQRLCRRNPLRGRYLSLPEEKRFIGGGASKGLRGDPGRFESRESDHRRADGLADPPEDPRLPPGPRQGRGPLPQVRQPDRDGRRLAAGDQLLPELPAGVDGRAGEEIEKGKVGRGLIPDGCKTQDWTFQAMSKKVTGIPTNHQK